MSAKNILLTHFSQRYPLIPNLPQISNKKGTVGCAFDLMKIKLSDFWKFRFILPILQKILVNPP
jgi:ribonuclease Z